MSSNNFYVHPELKKLYLLSSSITHVQLAGISIILLILYFFDIILTLFEGKFIPLFFILFALSIYLVITKIHQLLKATFFCSGLVLLMVLISKMSGSIFIILPLYTQKYVDAITTGLSNVSLIVISISVVIGIGAIVISNLKNSLSDVSGLLGWNSGVINDKNIRVIFTVLFLLSSTFIFYFFGDLLWLFTLDLLGDITVFDMVIVGLFSGYYLYNAFSRSTLL